MSSYYVDKARICRVAGMDAAGHNHYLTFGLSYDDDETRLGVYIEFDDRSNSGYGLVRHCHLTRRELSVDLLPGLSDSLIIDGFDVTLHVDDDSHKWFRVGLEEIFSAKPDVLRFD